MREVGLVGVPRSGKSTLFTALTRVGATGGKPHQAVVPVPDPRVEQLARLVGSRSVQPARLRFLDVPGGTSARGLAALREADVLCVVLRAFGPDPDPAGELAEVRADLLLADLAAVETALETTGRRARAGDRQAREEAERLERVRALLSSEVPLREAPLSEEDRRALRGLAPLTLKPWVAVANLEEGRGLPDGLPEGTVGVWAELEAEAASMDPEEARAILAEYGIERPGLGPVVEACYRALDLVTFLTANEQEARAWEVARGATAPEAAGVIHSDLQRGFIRAEVVSFPDLAAAGSWEEARRRGLVRVEGKDYVVQDGDVLQVRFAL